MVEETIRVRAIETGIEGAGIGYIVIPDENLREQYIADCYRTKTLTINGGLGYSYFYNVPCPPNVLQNIKFPDKGEKRGTAVIWVKHGISGMPIIINWLENANDYYQLKPNQNRKTIGDENRNIEIFTDGNETNFQITLIGDSEFPSKFNIKLNSENADSEFGVYCDNKINITSDNEISLNTNQKFVVNINDEGIQKASFVYDKGVGFTYSDEFDNKIVAKDGEVRIESKKINLGSGKEKVVLGNTLVKTLETLIDAITSITSMTPSGMSSTPINSPQFTVIKNQLSKILSNLSNTD